MSTGRAAATGCALPSSSAFRCLPANARIGAPATPQPPGAQFDNLTDVTFTSSGTGTLDGRGERWWGLPGIGYLVREEDRPRLFNVGGSRGILVERLRFINSPYWTFWVHGVDGLEVRWCEVSARRTQIDGHDPVDLTAFNTDGFDVSGRNVWIHDCSVWNQDDCIAVKDDAQDMLFERINASGVGLTIGSIGASTVRNITFRDCRMHKTLKGICASPVRPRATARSRRPRAHKIQSFVAVRASSPTCSMRTS